MSFPLDAFKALQAEALAIIEDRCKKGRNAKLSFYDRYLHGHRDKVQEIWERALRIAGSDERHDLTTMREDAIDLANEALLLVLLIDHVKGEKYENFAVPTAPYIHSVFSHRDDSQNGQ